jgi:hypothetical protein
MTAGQHADGFNHWLDQLSAETGGLFLLKAQRSHHASCTLLSALQGMLIFLLGLQGGAGTIQAAYSKWGQVGRTVVLYECVAQLCVGLQCLKADVWLLT